MAARRPSPFSGPVGLESRAGAGVWAVLYPLVLADEIQRPLLEALFRERAHPSRGKFAEPIGVTATVVRLDAPSHVRDGPDRPVHSLNTRILQLNGVGADVFCTCIAPTVVESTLAFGTFQMPIE